MWYSPNGPVSYYYPIENYHYDYDSTNCPFFIRHAVASEDGNILLGFGGGPDVRDPSDLPKMSVDGGKSWTKITNTDIPGAGGTGAVGISPDGTIQCILTKYFTLYIKKNNMRWKKIQIPAEPKDFHTDGILEVTNSGTLITTGNYGKLYISKDLGKTWKTITPQEGLGSHKLAITKDGKSIIALLYLGYGNADDQSILMRSDDLGDSWTTIATFKERIQRFLISEDAQVLVAQNSARTIISSRDSGLTWKTLLELDKDDFISAFFLSTEDNLTIKVLAYTDYIEYLSVDGGLTFTKESILKKIQG